MKDIKAPTHKDIMTKWWKIEGEYKPKNKWVKVLEYTETGYYSLLKTTSTAGICGSTDRVAAFKYVGKDWFVGRESSDIPREIKR